MVPTGISGCFLWMRLAPQPMEWSSHMRERNWGVNSLPRGISIEYDGCLYGRATRNMYGLAYR